MFIPYLNHFDLFSDFVLRFCVFFFTFSNWNQVKFGVHDVVLSFLVHISKEVELVNLISVSIGSR